MTQFNKTKQIYEYPIVMLGAGGLLGWLTHEMYIVYKIAELGL